MIPSQYPVREWTELDPSGHTDCCDASTEWEDVDGCQVEFCEGCGAEVIR